MTTWQEQAQQLRCGSRRRISHCKTDNSMLISHDLKGVSSHCFRCGFHGFIPHGVQRISDLMRRAREYRDKVSGKELVLPDDYTLDLPSHAMAWYLQYGISEQLARMYGIGYSERLDRVILPVHEGGDLTAIQMRALQEDVKPKYLNPSSISIQDVLFESEEGPSEWGVVTEDILSAIKVGQVLTSVSTLGTKMSDARAYKISEKYKNVILWYDNDRAGKIGLKNAERNLSLYGANVYKVCTELDPKKYTKKEIREILRGIERR